MFLPKSVQQILHTLHAHGHAAYAVGGCVRDSLMGRTPKDYDVATSARPDEVARLFPRVVVTGERYGTVTVLKEQPVEVTTFRVEGDYRDRRHPETVRFTAQIEEDLSRRDLTVNAIAFDQDSGYIDPFGGQADIRARVIRAVGEPAQRFSEDALRIMRVFRFASELNFTIEPRTLTACLSLVSLLNAVSVERITAELCRALMGEAADHLWLLFRVGGLSHLGFGRPKQERSLASLPRSLCCRLAALIYFCGGDGEKESKILSSLRLDNETKRLTGRMLKAFRRKEIRTPREIKELFRVISPENFPDFMITYGIIHHIPVERSLIMAKQVIEKREAWNLSMLDIDGAALMALGIQEGKAVGEVLDILLHCVLERPEINTKEILVMIAEEYQQKFLLPFA